MLRNRTVPTDTVLPHLVYADVDAAIDWLTRVFGAEEQFRYGDPTQGGQVRIEKAHVMLSLARGGRKTPRDMGAWTQMLTVFVEDLEGHHDRVTAEGGRITEALNTTPYGERQFAVEDLDGHIWLFARHVRDVAPEDWGARVP